MMNTYEYLHTVYVREYFAVDSSLEKLFVRKGLLVE